MPNEKRLFTPLTIKSLTFKNRIWLSPMCQYSGHDGYPTDWHYVHLGSRAVGGAGLVMVEATAVTPEGRISPQDLGLWSDDHIAKFKHISDFLKSQGAVTGIQIAHAGRKGSVGAPWLSASPIDAWQTIAPSAIAFSEGYKTPREMTENDIDEVRHAFVCAAERSIKAGFQVLELHMAHGYLMHQFLSPISNTRSDRYGGCLENRMRFPLELAQAVRHVWPDELPLFVRISATDWFDAVTDLHAPAPSAASWGLFESIVFSKKLKDIGVDLIDCSSGGTLPNATIPTGPGYQVPFSEIIRRESTMMTAAVGMITVPLQAETILLEKQADAIFIGREFLRNPYWPIDAARALGVESQRPKQYGRA